MLANGLAPSLMSRTLSVYKTLLIAFQVPSQYDSFLDTNQHFCLVASFADASSLFYRPQNLHKRNLAPIFFEFREAKKNRLCLALKKKKTTKLAIS